MACRCRYVSSASLEALGTAFKDSTLLMQRNYEIFYEELKLSCYQPQVQFCHTQDLTCKCFDISLHLLKSKRSPAVD